jgi:RNA polymerase sigma-70 factor (ECF subfamily)
MASAAGNMTASNASGRFDARFRAFIEAVSGHRARLHRYCNRMTGSALDGEDVMQDVLFEAYRKLELLKEDQPLAPWLFRIAHNRCIDFIRKRTVRHAREAAAAEPDVAPAVAFHGHGVGRALERLVLTLPPKERACVLLKDVFDHSLEEIAVLVDSTVGGVKAALNRGRSKLAALPAQPMAQAEISAHIRDLHALYADRFNRRDWDGIRQLISADARLRITDLYAGPASEQYFTRFEAMPYPWRLVAGRFDGEPVLILLGGLAAPMAPTVVVRLDSDGRLIHAIRHYTGCPWILADSASLSLDPDRPRAH